MFNDSNKQTDSLILPSKPQKQQQWTDGMFFKRSDIYFFQGINFFYLKQYDRAINYFNKSLELKKESIRKQEEKKKQ